MLSQREGYFRMMYAETVGLSVEEVVTIIPGIVVNIKYLWKLDQFSHVKISNFLKNLTVHGVMVLN